MFAGAFGLETAGADFALAMSSSKLDKPAAGGAGLEAPPSEKDSLGLSAMADESNDIR
jgi:hypothetical protein